MDNMKKCNYVISGVAGAIGIVIILLASKFPIKLGKGDPGAGFWPAILGAILILLAVILVMMTIKNKKKEEEKRVVLNLPANKRVYATMLLIVVFCALLYFLGFHIAVLCFIPSFMTLMQVKSKKTIIVTTIFTVVAIHIIFSICLKTPLPEPIFLR